MAKPKPDKSKAVPTPPDKEVRAMVLGIRGTIAWRKWLERAANHCRMNSSTLVDVAVSQYVKAQGFDEPPPPR